MKAWKRIPGFSLAIDSLHGSASDLTSLCLYLLLCIQAAVVTFVMVYKG